MKKNFFISIVLPAFNEEQNISESIKRAVEYSKGFQNYEVIVVNDGSLDGTAKIIERYADKNEKIKSIHHQKNKGYGATVWRGLREAKGDLVFFTDSDNQFDIKEVDKALPYLDRFDVVVGYRKNRKDSLSRKFNMHLWNFAVNLLFGLRIKDVDCAFKIFKRKVLSSVRIKSEGASFSPELMKEILTSGYKLKQIPVTHYPRRAGRSTGGDLRVIFKAIRELIILKIWN